MPLLGIIGTGMIGSSVGLAARQRGWNVLGYDVFTLSAGLAIDAGAVERVASRDEIYAACEVIVIAAHVAATIDELAALRLRSLRDDQLVIDVASVKAPIIRAAAGMHAFVATHPMAGSERSGPQAARADLFTERTWCYVPGEDAARTERARSLIEGFGAVPFAVDAQEHDAIVALTSHLPQLLAYAFTQRVGDLRAAHDPALVDALCGPAARELLRLGRSSPQMWNDIFAANGEAVQGELERLQRAIDDRRLSG